MLLPVFLCSCQAKEKTGKIPAGTSAATASNKPEQESAFAGRTIKLKAQEISTRTCSFHFSIRLPKNCGWNSEAPNYFRVYSENPEIIAVQEFKPQNLNFNYTIPVKIIEAGKAVLRIQADTYYCNKSNCCFNQPLDFVLPVSVSVNGKPDLSVEYELK